MHLEQSVTQGQPGPSPLLHCLEKAAGLRLVDLRRGRRAIFDNGLLSQLRTPSANLSRRAVAAAGPIELSCKSICVRAGRAVRRVRARAPAVPMPFQLRSRVASLWRCGELARAVAPASPTSLPCRSSQARLARWVDEARARAPAVPMSLPRRLRLVGLARAGERARTSAASVACASRKHQPRSRAVFQSLLS